MDERTDITVGEVSDGFAALAEGELASTKSYKSKSACQKKVFRAVD